MVRIAAVLLVLTMTRGAYAHHSVGVFYESDSSSEISGTITSVGWINPHIRFTLESVNDDNEREVWAVESGSVNMLERNGVGREQLVVGTRITVIGRPPRHGLQSVYATSVRTPDGRTVALQGLFGEPEAAAAGLLVEPQGPAASDPATASSAGSPATLRN